MHALRPRPRNLRSVIVLILARASAVRLSPAHKPTIAFHSYIPNIAEYLVSN